MVQFMTAEEQANLVKAFHDAGRQLQAIIHRDPEYIAARERRAALLESLRRQRRRNLAAALDHNMTLLQEVKADAARRTS